MVAFRLARRLLAFALLALSLSSFTAADLGTHGIEDVQDLLFEAQHNATLQQELEPLFGFEDARNEEKVNTNPLARANLFKRAGCTFYRTGDARTCVTVGDICCTALGGVQDGWCCPNTDGCGPGTGTLGKCTYKVSWTTSTWYRTSYTTSYRTYTSSLGVTTEWSTRTWYTYTTITSSMATATEWSTLTITTPSSTLRAGKRSIVPLTTLAFDDSTPSPSFTLSMPTPTAPNVQQNKQEVFKPEVTKAPKYIQIRGLLIPRQTMRTDTSERTVTRTTYITTTIETTTYRSSTYYTTYWTTSFATRTAALGARTTVTSITTLYLAAGETAPTSPEETSGVGFSGGGGGSSGGSSRKKGFSGGAKAGVGIGASLGFALIVALIAFLIRRHKAKKDGPDTASGGVQPISEFKAPIQSPVGPPGSMTASSPPMGSDPRYSQLSHPHFGTPSPGPGPVYGTYPQQGMAAAPMPMGSSPPPQQFVQPGMPPMNGSSPMGGSPPPNMQQYPQQGQYQYPRPLSPTYSGGPPSISTSGVGVQQPVPMQMGMQAGSMPPSEMPSVYSPHPQRP